MAHFGFTQFVYGAAEIKAAHERGGQALELRFTDDKGAECALTVFGLDDDYALRLTDAINSVTRDGKPLQFPWVEMRWEPGVGIVTRVVEPEPA